VERFFERASAGNGRARGSSSSSASSAPTLEVLNLQVSSIDLRGIACNNIASAIADVARGASAIGVLNLHASDQWIVNDLLSSDAFVLAASAAMPNHASCCAQLWIDERLKMARVPLCATSESGGGDWQEAVSLRGVACAGAAAVFRVGGVVFLLSWQTVVPHPSISSWQRGRSLGRLGDASSGRHWQGSAT
jgi:hypothetical protein